MSARWDKVTEVTTWKNPFEDLTQFCWTDFQNVPLTSNLYNLNLTQSLDRSSCNLRLLLQTRLASDNLKKHTLVRWFSFFFHHCRKTPSSFLQNFLPPLQFEQALSSGKDSIYKFFNPKAVHAQTWPSRIHFPTSEKLQEISFSQFSGFQINYIKKTRERELTAQ